MKKILSLLLIASLLALCVPAAAIGTRDVNPIGRSLADTNSPYVTAGGQASTTDFLNAEDFAAHTITIINAWDHMCGPCRVEMPYFQEAYDIYGDDGEVLIVGACETMIGGTIGGDYNYLQQQNYTYPNVIPDSVLRTTIRLNSFLPQSFIVDSEGTIIDFIPGSISRDDLFSKIAQWLAYYSDEYYDVTFVNGATNEVMEVQHLHAGLVPVYPTPPEVYGYTFSGWDPVTPPPVLSDMTITALYNANVYRVRFYDSITGEKIGNSQFIPYLQAADPPTPPEHEGYTFVGWDHDVSCITAAVDVYTIYSSGTFSPGDLDGDGSVTVGDSLIVLRGAMGLAQLSPEQQQAADMDGDGQVTMNDALVVLRRAMSLIA